DRAALEKERVAPDARPPFADERESAIEDARRSLILRRVDRCAERLGLLEDEADLVVAPEVARRRTDDPASPKVEPADAAGARRGEVEQAAIGRERRVVVAAGRRELGEMRGARPDKLSRALLRGRHGEGWLARLPALDGHASPILGWSDDEAARPVRREDEQASVGMRRRRVIVPGAVDRGAEVSRSRPRAIDSHGDP